MNIISFVRFTIRCLLGLLFLWQVRTSIQAYNLRQTIMVTSTVHRKNFTFPSFTFCPFDEHKSLTNNLTADYEMVETGHDFIYAIRQGFLNKPQFMNSVFIANISSPDLVHPYTKPYYGTFNRLVRCITYDPPELSKSGRDNAVLLLFNMTGLTEILSFVHNRDMYLHSSTNFHGLYRFQFPSSRTGNAENDSHISISEYILDTSFQQTLRSNLDSEYQCTNEYYKKKENGSAQTLETCYKSYIETQMDCNLPWTTQATKVNFGSNCDTASDYLKFSNIFSSFDSYTLLELQRNTMCIPPCGMEKHKISKMVQRAVPTDLPASKSKFLYGLTAQYKTSGYVKSKEVLLYDFKDVVADVGGYLGLLLGFSILNMFDLMIEAVRKIVVASKFKNRPNC